MYEKGYWKAMKAMPRGASTNSHGGITNYYGLVPQVQMMAAIGMPLLLHPECNHNWIWDRPEKPQDREKRFIYEVIPFLQKVAPGLTICLEHISSKESAMALKKHGNEKLVGTATPQHVMQSFPMFYEKGMPWVEHMHPGYKDWDDWDAVRDVIASGCPWLGAGEDGAPHFYGKKIDCLGCPGGFFTTKGVALYLQILESMGSLQHAENFLSVNTLHIYGLKPSDEYVIYSNEGEPDTIDDVLRVGDDFVHPWGYHMEQAKRHKFTWKQVETAA
jgi:dihydroorotase